MKNQKTTTTPIFKICEYIGSTFLVIAAIAPIILFTEILSAPLYIAVIADALAVGFILFALIEILDPICTAYFNPIVSIAYALIKRITWKQAFHYSIIQILGGITGVLLTHLMFYQDIPQLIALSTTNRSGGTYIAEILGTFILVLCILSLAHQKSSRVSLVVGLLVGGMLLATSSTMFVNPQVTIARILTYSSAGISVADATIFIGMQLIGMVLAVIIWTRSIQNCRINTHYFSP
jgi:glycerol uptake facilitator-like aquaporin